MFKPYVQEQDFLLPPSFREFLSQDHEALIVSELIDSLDLSSLCASYKNALGGASAYHPALLLKVLIYAYAHKTFSSRAIAHALRSDLAFMYLAGCQRPDFRTVNRFRKEKGELLKTVFLQVAQKALGLGMISLGTVSLDGTKIAANASKEKNKTLSALDKDIEALCAQAEKADATEDALFGDDDGRGVPEDLRTSEGRARKLKELAEEERKKEGEAGKEKEKEGGGEGGEEEERKARERRKDGQGDRLAKLDRLREELRRRILASKAFSDGGKARKNAHDTMCVNATDPESRLMQMKRKDYAQGYNAQILTENQFVLSTHLSAHPADYHELLPALQAFQENFHQAPKTLLADMGYYSAENIAFLQEHHTDALIPPPPSLLRKQDTTKDMTYSPERNAYTDISGNVFIFKQKKGPQCALYRCADYQRAGKHKFLQVNTSRQAFHKTQQEKLATPEGKTLYARRKVDVETVFARIKHLLGFQRFSLRGLRGATTEWNLICIVHNLKKIMSYQARTA